MLNRPFFPARTYTGLAVAASTILMVAYLAVTGQGTPLASALLAAGALPVLLVSGTARALGAGMVCSAAAMVSAYSYVMGGSLEWVPLATAGAVLSALASEPGDRAAGAILVLAGAGASLGQPAAAGLALLAATVLLRTGVSRAVPAGAAAAVAGVAVASLAGGVWWSSLVAGGVVAASLVTGRFWTGLLALAPLASPSLGVVFALAVSGVAGWRYGGRRGLWLVVAGVAVAGAAAAPGAVGFEYSSAVSVVSDVSGYPVVVGPVGGVWGVDVEVSGECFLNSPCRMDGFSYGVGGAVRVSVDVSSWSPSLALQALTGGESLAVGEATVRVCPYCPLGIGVAGLGGGIVALASRGWR